MWVMRNQLKRTRWGLAAVPLALITVVSFASPAMVSAITAIPTPNPEANSYGLEAIKPHAAPTTGATISTPGSGGTYSTSPITVSGLCPTGLLVQVYDNGVLVGAVDCKGGSFSIQVSLFTGQNDLTATVFDDLDQAGPVSNTVSVTYNNSSFAAFGQLVTITSPYARRAANPGSTLTWPLILAGGSGPYALSIDWGDGSTADLKSIASPGQLNINHVYKTAGLYHVTVKVTDANGVSAFIQLVAIANGTAATTASGSNTKTTAVVTKVVWIPGLIAIILLFPTYWLGRRSELHSLHHQLEKSMADFREL